jgi:hypothetical protein
MDNLVGSTDTNPVCPKCGGDMINVESFEMIRRKQTILWRCYCVDCTHLDPQPHSSPASAIKAWTKEPTA